MRWRGPPTNRSSGRRRRTSTPTTLYLRGRFLVNRLTGQFEALFAARDAFQEAVTLDPEYAAAYAGLSEAYCSLAYLTFLPTREASEAALAAAHRAVALDPGLAEAHTAVGWTKTLFAIDMATAEQDFVRAIELAPSFAPAHGYYVLLLASLGRFDEALARAERTRQLDPVWLRGPFNICITLICARQFEKAERQVREIMALDANLEGTYWFLSSALAGQGRLDEAIAALEKGVPLVYRAPLFVALLGPLVCACRTARRCRSAPRRADRRRTMSSGLVRDPLRRSRRSGTRDRLPRSGDRRAQRSGVLHDGRSPLRRAARASAVRAPARANRPSARVADDYGASSLASCLSDRYIAVIPTKKTRAPTASTPMNQVFVQIQRAVPASHSANVPSAQGPVGLQRHPQREIRERGDEDEARQPGASVQHQPRAGVEAGDIRREIENQEDRQQRGVVGQRLAVPEHVRRLEPEVVHQQVDRQPEREERLEDQVPCQPALVQVRPGPLARVMLQRGGEQGSGTEGNGKIDLYHLAAHSLNRSSVMTRR